MHSYLVRYSISVLSCEDGEVPRSIFYKPTHVPSSTSVISGNEDLEEGKDNDQDRGDAQQQSGGNLSSLNKDSSPSQMLNSEELKAKQEHDEFFRISNIRLELEEERRLTRDLRQQLGNCERE